MKNVISDLIKAPQSLFDYQKSSLPKIENYLYRNIITDDFSDRIFLPLLAYIGETFIEHEGGEWRVEYSEVYNTWIPDVYYENRQKQIWRPLLKILDSTDTIWRPLMTAYMHKVRV